MIDRLLELSEKQKEKKIEYHCLDSKTSKKIIQENFEFIPVIKEEYSFDQIFKLYDENII